MSALASGHPDVADLLIGNARAEGLGSNNWVVDGTLTASGKPLLANDPHLGTRLPSIWYLAHLSAPDFDVIGATLPGAPAVALGRNRDIAWGATNVAADVEDLYRERLDPAGRAAEFRGTMEPLRIVDETVAVKGGQPVHVQVRISRHGPLVSDAINASNAEATRGPRREPLEPLAFRWTALDPNDTTVVAFLKLNQARDWNGFVDAMRSFVVPSQNFVYADTRGHIGYYAPGHIPVRAAGNGSMPADGWTGDAEWTGWVPFDELPHVLDPPEHLIVTANDRPVGGDYPHLLGLEWPVPYRAQRIRDLLRRDAKFTPDDFAAIQADRLSLHARAMAPRMLAHAKPSTDADRRAVDAVKSWNLVAGPESAAAAIFEVWFLHLAPAIAADDLGPLALRSYESRTTFVTRFLEHTLDADDEAWCDDQTTPQRETCDDEVTRALHETVAELTDRMGSDQSSWRWDRIHPAVFPHSGLDAVALLRPLLSRSVPSAGDWSTVDVGAVSTDFPYEQRSVPGYREIIDLSPANDSRFLNDIGESGHPLSRHYADFLEDWRNVRERPMRMDRSAIDRGALGRLRLVPN